MCAVAPRLPAWPTVLAGTGSRRRSSGRRLRRREQPQESLGGLSVPLDLDRAVVNRAPMPQHRGESRRIGCDLRIGARRGAPNNVELAAGNARAEAILAERDLDLRVAAVGRRSIEDRLERD